jgi:hypothetical protein
MEQSAVNKGGAKVTDTKQTLTFEDGSVYEGELVNGKPKEKGQRKAMYTKAISPNTGG